MKAILGEMTGDFVMVYIDDIVIYSKSEEEHRHHLEMVFDSQEWNGLKLGPSKCKFDLPSVELLQFIVSAEGIECRRFNTL